MYYILDGVYVLFLFRFRKVHAVAGVCIVLEREHFNTVRDIKCNINAECVSNVGVYLAK